ncbi:hypothetical protein GE09DRAFT_1057786 [Coniochaeta sp. 2T2.1]|nr:hypothetical protein GE09DRAFT_1057786 [Coniochaeta sp. 2T2.1]
MDHMNMPGASGSDSSAHSDAQMVMQSVFQTIPATPLYSVSWTPSSTGQYAGTCIFLILFAASLRGLLAAKAYLEHVWLDRELKRRYVVVNGGGKLPLAQRLSQDSDAKQVKVVLSENGVEEDVLVVGRKKPVVRPWRVSVDLPRAAVDVVIVGVGYLL